MANQRASVGLALALLASALMGAGGCSSSGHPDSGADLDDSGMIADAEPTDAGPPVGGCNALTQFGVAVTPSCDPGVAPAATGGDIADGTYDLNESHFYGICSTVPLAETLVVSQGTGQSIATKDDGSEIRTTVSFLVNGDGTSLNATQRCPASVQTSLLYTATATTLTTYLSTVLSTRMSIFTLQ
jgi:hypothetical protein